MIERIRIQGYRSLHDVDVRLDPLTVLIGRSGSGKSNFVRALRLLRDVLGGSQDAVNLLNAGVPFGDSPHPTVSVEVELYVKKIGSLKYSILLHRTESGLDLPLQVGSERLSFGPNTIFERNRDRWLVRPPATPLPTLKMHGLVLGTLTGVRESSVAYIALTRGLAFYDFTGSVVQDSANLEAAPGYPGTPDTALVIAGRVADDIGHHEDWRDVGKTLAALNTKIESLDLVLPGRNQLRVGYRVGGTLHTVDVAEESEGFRRYLAHMLALYQTPRKQTMLFEHPESGIHPGALKSLADEFQEHVDDGRGQVILTTHSPQLLDHFQPDSIRAVEVSDGVTRIGKVSAEQLDALHGNMMAPGDLLTADKARIGEPAGAGV